MLQGNYGSRFLNQWKTGQLLPDGQDAGLVNAMATWGERLAGFEKCPEAIGDVLRALPPEPPTLPGFADLCRIAMKRHAGQHAALPHRLTPEEQAKADEAARRAWEAIDSERRRDRLAWAKQPRSSLTLAAVIHEAQRSEVFREILDGLVRDGVATRDGRLLKRYDGRDWVSA